MLCIKIEKPYQAKLCRTLSLVTKLLEMMINEIFSLAKIICRARVIARIELIKLTVHPNYSTRLQVFVYA